MVGGTDHVTQDKGHDAGVQRLPVVNSVTPLIINDEHLGLLQLWCRRGVSCG